MSRARRRQRVSSADVVVLACFGLLVMAEHFWPLRRAREPKPRRFARNLALAGLGAIVQTLERACSERVAAARSVSTGRSTPRVLRAAQGLVGVLALDYTLYVWHVLTHQQPFLWRFHAVHHADRDLDVSTALRFHVSELAFSIPWRVAQVRLLGISPQVLSIWQTGLILSVLFQHSNVRLPARLERCLAYAVVTPQLHGIHHSSRASERNANWGSGLTIWDRLHGTFRVDVAQERIEIGIAEAQTAEQVTLGKLLRARLLQQYVAPRGQNDG